MSRTGWSVWPSRRPPFARIVRVFVLGVDPGLTRCGFAVVAPGPRGGGKARTMGVITTDRAAPIAERLGELQGEVEQLLVEFRPDQVAVERVFFQQNVHTAVYVAQALGLVMAAAARRKIPVSEYSPSQIKAAVAGDGRADKSQMQEMVRTLLGLSAVPSPADAADAAAVALCHLAHDPFGRQARMVGTARLSTSRSGGAG